MPTTGAAQACRQAAGAEEYWTSQSRSPSHSPAIYVMRLVQLQRACPGAQARRSGHSTSPRQNWLRPPLLPTTHSASREHG